MQQLPKDVKWINITDGCNVETYQQNLQFQLFDCEYEIRDDCFYVCLGRTKMEYYTKYDPCDFIINPLKLRSEMGVHIFNKLSDGVEILINSHNPFKIDPKIRSIMNTFNTKYVPYFLYIKDGFEAFHGSIETYLRNYHKYITGNNYASRRCNSKMVKVENNLYYCEIDIDNRLVGDSEVRLKSLKEPCNIFMAVGDTFRTVDFRRGSPDGEKLSIHDLTIDKRPTTKSLNKKLSDMWANFDWDKEYTFTYGNTTEED